MKRSEIVSLSSLLLLVVPCYLFSLPFVGFTGAIAASSGALLGCLVALVSRRWHLGVVSILTLLLGVYLLFGPTLAATDPLGRKFYPTLSGLQLLVTSAVTCWRDTLTAPLPLSAAGEQRCYPSSPA